MKPYGDKPTEGEYYDWFEKIDLRQPQLDNQPPKTSVHSVHATESNRSDTLRPDVKIEFGVNEIRVTGGGKTSRTFNDGTSGKTDPGIGETGEDCFNFSPTHDSAQMKLKVQVHHPHFIKSAKLEMYCRGHKVPIWTRCWGNLWNPTIPGDTNRKIDEVIPQGNNDGTADFEINWSEIQLPKDLRLPGGCGKPDFIDGVPTVPRSPYQLKFSVSARASISDSAENDKFGFPQMAWTFAHVLVKEITLAWGKDELIPKTRTDFKYNMSKRSEVEKMTNDLLTLKSDRANKIAEMRKKDQDLIQAKGLDLAATKSEGRKTTLEKEIFDLKAKTQADYDKWFDGIVSNQEGLNSGHVEVLKRQDEKVALDAASLESDLLRRQKLLFAKISGTALSPGQGDPQAQPIEVNLNVPRFNDTKSDDEFYYYRGLWGEGPLIPLVLKAKLKDIGGNAVDDPEGLGRAQFLWEWQDNQNADLDVHLDSWLTIASGITKTFIKKVFKDNRDEVKYPYHGFNCPAKYGGKRGTMRPASEKSETFVFPASLPHFQSFPALVTHDLKKRDWGAISYCDPTVKLQDKDGNDASTAVLFQPSIIAGDRFRVSALLVTEDLAEFDKDLDSDKYYDLIKDATTNQIPWVTTYYFEVWRHINVTYCYSPSFQTAHQNIIRDIKTQLTREIGYKLNIDSKALPDARTYFSANVTDMIRTIKGVNENCMAIALRAGTKMPPGNSDYGFDVPEKLSDLEDLYKSGTWLLAEFKDGDPKGMEIYGLTSKGRAFVSQNIVLGAEGKKPVLMVEGTNLTEGEKFDCGEATTVKGTINKIKEPLLVRNGITFDLASDDKMSSRSVTVSAETKTTTLSYPEGKINATRQLSTNRIEELKNFCAKLKGNLQGQAIVIKITGKRDTRGIERARLVKEWFEQNALDTLKVMNADLSNESLRKFDYRECYNLALKELIVPSFKQDYPDWEKDGRAIFYHLRGRTNIDKSFTTGGIENNWCNETFGICGVTQPPVTPDQRLEKRWLKTPEIVVAHEFGHLFMLKHSAPRVMDSKYAGGLWIEHLAHDTCLMNYDPDTLSLCGWCMLRKRGWQVSKVISDGQFIPNNKTWVQECKKQMMLDATKSPAGKVRMAMFLLDIKKWDPNATETQQDAIGYMNAARMPPITDKEKSIFMLRCEVVFYNKIKNVPKAQQSLDSLLANTDFYVDYEDLANSERKVKVDDQVASFWFVKESS